MNINSHDEQGNLIASTEPRKITPETLAEDERRKLKSLGRDLCLLCAGTGENYKPRVGSASEKAMQLLRREIERWHYEAPSEREETDFDYEYGRFADYDQRRALERARTAQDTPK